MRVSVSETAKLTGVRFMKNINKFGDGTAELMSQAIKIYCTKK